MIPLPARRRRPAFAVYEARGNLKDPYRESESGSEEAGSESEQDEEGEDDVEDGEEDN